MKTYGEKLKAPQWQKKRLEILQRDGWKCVVCGSQDNTLHVRHKTYTYGNDPWDYPNTNFITLCGDCHEDEHNSKEMLMELIHDLLLMGHTHKSIHRFFLSSHYNGDIKLPVHPEKTNG